MAYKNWLAGDKFTAAELTRLAKSSGADNITITYNADGKIATITDTDTTPDAVYTFTWNGDLLASITDGTNTWTFAYDAQEQLTSITRT